MTGRIFVDSNVLVYWRDASAVPKQRQASDWLARLWRDGQGRLSLQVLQEYYVTVTRKVRPPIAPNDARRDVANLTFWHPLPVTRALLDDAFLLEDRHRLSFWDALIVAAARATDCDYLLTEELHDGQDLGGLKVINPFHYPPEAALGK